MDHGAHFHRCDFQVHTPRDENWHGEKPTTDGDRRAYARRFVEACRERGLQGVAITDHHDFALFEFIAEAAASETRSDGTPLDPNERLVAFPGLELTLAVPCQALLILDADFPVERLNSVLERLAIEPTDPALPSHSKPKPLGHIQDLQSLYAELDRSTWLRNHYTVLPNVTDGGHKTLMRKGMQEKYRDMPCVGGYIDGDVKSKIGTGNTRIFAGLDSAWGNKAIAQFQTSDSRSDTFADLGKHSTWVKWAEPTAEAIRQACLAQQSRIMHTRPVLPNVYLTRLSVSNSRYMGPIELELNPQYNAVIGGRGTGKSTCLEYIRWALCDQPPSQTSLDELPDHAGRRRRLITETLQPFDATVDIHFLVNGIAHIVRRHSKSSEVFLKVAGGEFAPAVADDIRALLPIEAYSQRQLSSVAVRLDEVTRFVTAPIRRELEEITSREAAVAGEIRENYALLQRQRLLERAIARDTVTATSLAEQASNLRSQLTALSPEDQAVLEQKPKFDAADETVRLWLRRVEQLERTVDQFRSSVEALRSDLPRVADLTDAPEPSTLAGLEAAVADALAAAGASVDSLVGALHSKRAPNATLAKHVDTWKAAHAKFETEYAGAKERSSAHASKLAELSGLEVRRKELSESLATQREELKAIGDPGARHAALRAQWVGFQSERSALLEAQCSLLTELSGGLIRATLERRTGLAAITERFKASIAGSGVRSSKTEAFVEQIGAAPDPLASWHEALDALELFVLSGEDPSPRSWAATGALSKFAAADAERMTTRMTPESIVEMSLTPISDRPVFEYRVKENDYIQFAVASAGQQATALLRVLLNQSGPPLVIDQPEDDLDSQVILDVVNQIWTAKAHRQLIFSSHNANLVVNGDAELVVCCDYRAAGDQSGGKIKLEGAIDMPKVRDEITTVMEGGEKAFRMRKDKYGF